MKERKGRVTKSVHIPLSALDVLDQAIAISGLSESAYIGSAALDQARRDIARAERQTPKADSETTQGD